MKAVVLLALLASAVSTDVPCGTGLVAVPKDTESYECYSEAELEQLQQIEAGKRFNAESGTRFLLWTQATPSGAWEELPFNNQTALEGSTFDPRNPTRVLVHGWLNDWKSDAVHGLAEAYLAKGAYNVIGVDWSAGASAIIYVTARLRVSAVADAVAKQIGTLLRAGQHPSQIVIIGHSLGAHVAGLTGKHFQAEPKLGAIVALDPAGPLFRGDDPSARVDAVDAQYVEVIHTNGGRLGLQEPLGQADFYPNGGQSQPGCLTDICSHHRAIEYYIRSLQSAGPLYVGHRCPADQVNDRCDGLLAVMGSDLSDGYKVKASGLFYLATGK